MSEELKAHTSKDVAKHGCAGGCIGAFFGLGFISIGLLLSLTGIGAIIGIPMILIGLVMPFSVGGFTGLMGMITKKGNCPYCNFAITVTPMPGIDCPACKKRILNQNGILKRFEE